MTLDPLDDAGVDHPVRDPPVQPHQRAAVMQDVERRGPRPVHDAAERRAEPGPEDRAFSLQAVFHPGIAVIPDGVPQAAERLLELHHALDRFRGAHGGRTAIWFQPRQLPDAPSRHPAALAAAAGGEQVTGPRGERKIIKFAYASHDTRQAALRGIAGAP
jgi:hypothetical protein